MHSTLNIRFILRLCSVVAILTVAVYGNGTSPNSTPVNANNDSHNTGKAIKSLEATLEKYFQKLIHAVNVASGVGSGSSSSTFASCKDIYSNGKSKENRAYLLQMDSGKVPDFCHMTTLGACGDGGWTLVMKIDGAKKTFHYDSDLWYNKIGFNFPGGKSGYDQNETKLPTYWNTSFSKICLGMKIGKQINFVLINKQADSLYSLIADGQYRATLLGRSTWKTLIGSQASLQYNCNKEGFNVECTVSNAKARIGILSNNENDCSNCDSRVGFGTKGHPDDSNTCGNEAKYSPDNGEKHIKAMGYILVQ